MDSFVQPQPDQTPADRPVGRRDASQQYIRRPVQPVARQLFSDTPTTFASPMAPQPSPRQQGPSVSTPIVQNDPRPTQPAQPQAPVFMPRQSQSPLQQDFSAEDISNLLGEDPVPESHGLVLTRQHATAVDRTPEAEQTATSKVKKQRRLRKPPMRRLAPALALVLVAGAVTFAALHFINKPKVITPTPASVTYDASATASAKAVTIRDVKSYKVSGRAPRIISIPVLGVYARVLQVSTASDGQLGSADNIFDTAWYSSSAQPGASGVTVINGRTATSGTEGVFHNIGKLTAGDDIEITTGDGKVYKYLVAKTTAYSASNVTNAVLHQPVPYGASELNLVSANGSTRISVLATLSTTPS